MASNLAGIAPLSSVEDHLPLLIPAPGALSARSTSQEGPSMTIKVGDKLPSVQITEATAEGPKPVSTDDFFKGKRVALFAVPGAFTPTCSAKHLPGFKQR